MDCRETAWFRGGSWYDGEPIRYAHQAPSYVLTPNHSAVHLIFWRPSLYLSSCMVTWAAITMCMSAVPTYHAALILRFWLGFVEATFMPGAVFLLPRWYRVTHGASFLWRLRQ
ncbi:hypothetical protein EDD22DRAFT_212747 [Suillus occidentalis]|nr:hypothetical protein EDD22DRAFT_212747 [Suillus occidentalis]